MPTAWIELVLREGRNRQVRRMTAAVGHPTLRLLRVGLGPLRLDGLAPGERRELTPAEVAALRALAAQATQKPRPNRSAKATSKGTQTARKATPARGQRANNAPRPRDTDTTP